LPACAGLLGRPFGRRRYLVACGGGESELTAGEFVVNASLYANGRHNEAAKLYRGFTVDFRILTRCADGH